MRIDNDKTWIEHPELAGKAIRSLRRTDGVPGGDNYIVIEFEDGTRFELGANDLGTWVIQSPVEYAASNLTEHLIREAKPDYAEVKALAAQLAPADRLRLIDELTVQQAEIPGTAQQLKRHASDFYGIWRGVVFSEDDFKAAEWHPSDEALNAT
jgi:hypothetical protein